MKQSESLTQKIKWQAKKDRDGNPLSRCWITDSGYTVAATGRDSDLRYYVSRPGETTQLMAVVSTRDEVIRVIEEDMKAGSKP